MQYELNRRLKLDLLISVGNVAAFVPDPTHTLLNLHFVIPKLPFVIVVISSQLFSRREIAQLARRIFLAL